MPIPTQAILPACSEFAGTGVVMLFREKYPVSMVGFYMVTLQQWLRAAALRARPSASTDGRRIYPVD
jgi:hypothetical protein